MTAVLWRRRWLLAAAIGIVLIAMAVHGCTPTYPPPVYPGG